MTAIDRLGDDLRQTHGRHQGRDERGLHAMTARLFPQEGEEGRAVEDKYRSSPMAATWVIVDCSTQHGIEREPLCFRHFLSRDEMEAPL